MILND